MRLAEIAEDGFRTAAGEEASNSPMLLKLFDHGGINPVKSDKNTFSIPTLIDSSLFIRRRLEFFSQNAVHAAGIC